MRVTSTRRSTMGRGKIVRGDDEKRSGRTPGRTTDHQNGEWTRQSLLEDLERVREYLPSDFDPTEMPNTELNKLLFKTRKFRATERRREYIEKCRRARAERQARSA